MQGRCKKPIAVLLCSVMFFLTVGAELTHNHCFATSGQSHAIAEFTGGSGSMVKQHSGLGFICVGCIYALSHIATFVSCQSLLPLAGSTLLDPPVGTLSPLPGITTFSNRAPPLANL